MCHHISSSSQASGHARFGSVFCSLQGFTVIGISCLLTWLHLSELLGKIFFSCLTWIYLMVRGLSFILPLNGFSQFSASSPVRVFWEAARCGMILMIFYLRCDQQLSFLVFFCNVLWCCSCQSIQLSMFLLDLYGISGWGIVTAHTPSITMPGRSYHRRQTF